MGAAADNALYPLKFCDIGRNRNLYLFRMMKCQQKLCKVGINHRSKIYIMAIQRQPRGKRKSTQAESLETKDAQQVENNQVEEQPKRAEKSAKSADLEYLEEFDVIANTIEQKPHKIDLKQSTKSIDVWYGILHKSEDKSLRAIATELKDLKQLLMGDKLEAADLSQKLIHIGDLTTTTAATAGRGFKGVIQKLGKVLSTFGRSLEEGVL